MSSDLYTDEQIERSKRFAFERQSRIVKYKRQEGEAEHMCFCGGPIAARIIEEPYLVGERWCVGIALCVDCIRLLAQRVGLLK